MAGKWTGGIVESMAERNPPTVEDWTPVECPGHPTRFAGVSTPVAYRTRFEDPREAPDERTLLELAGVYGSVHVWANGTYVGARDCRFAPVTFEFDPAAENELHVVWSPSDRATGAEATDAPEADDWGGIGWDVRIDRRPPTFLRRLEVEPRLTDDGAYVDANVTVDAGRPVDDRVTLSLRPEGSGGAGSMERVRVEAGAGEQASVNRRIEIRDPSPWWPRDLGPQNRYSLEARLGDDAVERTIGLRRVERDEDGFLVNGERVHARGFTRYPGGDERADVRRAAGANATILRLRGHVPSHEFYDACDEAGILVWQDLPVGDDLDVEPATDVVEALSAAYGGHPSLATVGIQEVGTDPFTDGIGSGSVAKLAFRWRAWQAEFDRSDAETVAAAVDDDVDVIPVTGPPGTGADAATVYPGWRYLDAADAGWLLRYRSVATAVGAFGAGSVASDDPADAATFGPDGAVLERRVTDPPESRSYQATVLKTVVEALRLGGCGVLAAETLRDRLPGSGMGVLRRTGEAKPAYEAIAQSYEPVQAIVDGRPSRGSVDVFVVNDTADAVAPTVTWRADDRSGEVTASVPPFESERAGRIDVPADADRLEFELAVGSRTVRNRYRL